MQNTDLIPKNLQTCSHAEIDKHLSGLCGRARRAGARRLQATMELALYVWTLHAILCRRSRQGEFAGWLKLINLSKSTGHELRRVHAVFGDSPNVHRFSCVSAMKILAMGPKAAQKAAKEIAKKGEETITMEKARELVAAHSVNTNRPSAMRLTAHGFPVTAVVHAQKEASRGLLEQLRPALQRVLDNFAEHYASQLVEDAAA